MNNDDNKPNTAITVAIIGGIFALCAAVVSVIRMNLLGMWHQHILEEIPPQGR